MIRTLLRDSLSEGASAPTVLRVLLKSCTRASGLCVVLHRVAERAGHHLPLLGDAIKQLNQFLTGADIAWRASIGAGLHIYHPQGVVIGAGVVMGEHCAIQQGVTIGTKHVKDDPFTSSPMIGSRVLLGAGARVLGRITIGDRVAVGANAVCIRDAPNNSLVVGIPGRVILRDAVAE